MQCLSFSQHAIEDIAKYTARSLVKDTASLFAIFRLLFESITGPSIYYSN